MQPNTDETIDDNAQVPEIKNRRLEEVEAFWGK